MIFSKKILITYSIQAIMFMTGWMDNLGECIKIKTVSARITNNSYYSVPYNISYVKEFERMLIFLNETFPTVFNMDFVQVLVNISHYFSGRSTSASATTRRWAARLGRGTSPPGWGLCCSSTARRWTSFWTRAWWCCR